MVSYSSHSQLLSSNVKAGTLAADSTTPDKTNQSFSKKKESLDYRHILLVIDVLQRRELNLGKDRYRRRLGIVPHTGGVYCNNIVISIVIIIVYCKSLEAGEAIAGSLIPWSGKTASSIGLLGEDRPLPAKKEEIPEVKPETLEEKKAVTGNGIDPTSVEEDFPADHVEMKNEEEVIDTLPVHSLVIAVERDPAEEDLGAEDRPKKNKAGDNEEVDRSEMVPIPESMSRRWCRIIDPGQVKIFVESCLKVTIFFFYLKLFLFSFY